ncbi:MAG: hypothetical protein WAO58_00010 [Fimbriimonadaceae bacterium]
MNKYLSLSSFLCLLLTSAVLCSHTGDVALDWRSAIARSAKQNVPKLVWKWQRASFGHVKKGTPGRAGRIKFRNADPEIYIYEDAGFRRISAEEAADRQRRVERVAAEQKRARDKFDQNDRPGARRILETIIRDEPDDETLARDLADVCFAQREYQEAFYLIGRFADQSNSEKTLVRASLASSLMGWTFEGQKDFCDKVTRRYFDGFSGITEALPQGHSARDVQISSLLAIAALADRDGQAIVFYDMILLIEPRNVLANYSLGEIRLRNRAFRDAASSFAVSARDGAGSIKMIAQQKLELARALSR